MAKSNIGKYVVYWDGGGTNTHHYFETFEEAEKYCAQDGTHAPSIAFVVYESAIRKDVTKMEDMAQRIKQIEGAKK